MSRHSPPKDSRCHSLNYSLTCCCVDFQPRFSFKSDTMSLTPTGDVLLHWNSCKLESDSRRESFLDKNTISWQGHLELMSGNKCLLIFFRLIFCLFWHESDSENFRYVIKFVLQYPSAQSKTSREILRKYRGSQFMYFNKKTVHICTNSLGRGSKE